MKKLITAMALASFAASPLAFAQDTTFTDIDTDGDGLLSLLELQVVMPDVTENDMVVYDSNADSKLSKDEFQLWKSDMERRKPAEPGDDMTPQGS